ncbi:MAG: hypothetical protein U0441_07370 [Polyangiaceae bacterium]
MQRSFSSVLVLGLFSGALSLSACEGSGGETGGAGGTTTTTSSTTTSSSSTTDTTSTTDSTGGTGGTTETTSSTTTVMTAKCPGDPVVELTGEIAADKLLTSDKCYLLKGIVYVKSGATLTIEPGTTVMGEQVSLGTLVIQPGGKIDAQGTADLPIVFTSQKNKGERAPGDWGGVILLGKAPINIQGGQASIEGIPPSPETMYGGSAPDDSSGILQYVRIEFAGVQLSPNNEINGLTFGGVGNKTTIDHIMVHDALDDCYEFFGGTVNAKYLLCANNQDDGFDWDNGFSGKLQFVALQQDPAFEDDTNGFEGDNDANASVNTPISNPTIYNATLVGKNLATDGAKQQYGALVRRSTKGQIHNAIWTGFEACVDVRDAATSVEIHSSICYGNGYGTAENNIAYAEVAGGMGVLSDDDAGLDERAWFKNPAWKNAETDPKLTAPFATTPDFTPATTITANAATPPNDGFFDTTATYVGAFKAGENWATGAWVSFDRN